MKTTSRRRVLVSSVSMLLVATLALGTATFAWFTNNTSVAADGLQVKAGAATGLQITGDNGDEWGPKYTFNKDGKTTIATLQPVSADYSKEDGTAYDKFGTPYFPGEAKVDGPWSEEDTANFLEWTPATYPKATETTGDAYAANEFFAVYEVGIKSTTGAIKEDVYMKLNYVGDENKGDFIRVAVLKQGGTSTNIAGDTIVNVYGSDTAPNAINAISPVKSEAQKLVGPDATQEDKGIKIADGGKVTSTPQYFTVLVWFEGQDEQCTDVNQQATGTITIDFYYTPETN